MYRIAIFDLDGTILNTLEDLCDSLNHALALYSMPQRSLAQVRSYLGNGIRALVECGVPENTPPILTDAVFAEFASYYPAHCRIKTAPYPGILQLFSNLRENGIKIAVISNKVDTVVQTLCTDFFPELLDYCIGEKSGIRKKPCPDSLNHVLQLLGAAPQDALYIGDSEVDAKTAENAGVDCALVSWGFRKKSFLKTLGTRYLVHNPQELFEIIRK